MTAMAGIDGDTLDRHFLTLTPPSRKHPIRRDRHVAAKTPPDGGQHDRHKS